MFFNGATLYNEYKLSSLHYRYGTIYFTYLMVRLPCVDEQNKKKQSLYIQYIILYSYKNLDIENIRFTDLCKRHLDFRTD